MHHPRKRKQVAGSTLVDGFERFIDNHNTEALLSSEDGHTKRWISGVHLVERKTHFLGQQPGQDGEQQLTLRRRKGESVKGWDHDGRHPKITLERAYW